MKNQIEIHGNKLTLPDRVIEWSFVKFEFIDQCKKGDFIIHDKLDTLGLAKLFNKAVKGLDVEDRRTKSICQHLADNWFTNYCWLLDSFSMDAMSKHTINNGEHVFRFGYAADIVGEDNCKIFYNNIVVKWKTK